MALSTRTATAARNTMLDALAALCNTGYLRVYSGSQPATPETAASGTLLAELRMNSTAFPASSGGVLTANAITDDSSADATGTAGYFRVLKSDGTTAVFDGTAGIGSSYNLNLVTDQINAGNVIQVTGLTYTVVMQGA